MKAHRTQVAVRMLLFSFTLLVPSIAFAQHESAGQWYLVGMFGSWTDFRGSQVGAGVGYERLIYKGLAAGAEFEGFGGTAGYGGTVVSANGSYHFRNPGEPRKLVPFGTAGVSGMVVCGGSGCGAARGFNFGGGLNYWAKPNRGLRVEFRDHVLYDYGATHKVEMRIGFAF